MYRDINKISAIVDDLHKEYYEKYGCTIFDIETTRSDDDGIILKGRCLTRKQLDLLKRRVDLFHESRITIDVEVLSENPEDISPMGWGMAASELVDIMKDYSLKKLSSQVTPDDGYFKIILKNNGKCLILLRDKTMGWVLEKDVEHYDTGISNDDKNFIVAKFDETIKVDSIAQLFCEAKKFVDNVSYLLGGRSQKGIDCSALMQLIFQKGLDIIIPRHSSDQMKCGIRLSKKTVKSGDLLFAKLKESNIMHVGLVGIDDTTIIHSCLRAKRVISENIEDFYKYYSFARARRIVEKKNNVLY